MTKAGKLESEFLSFKKEMEAKIAELEKKIEQKNSIGRIEPSKKKVTKSSEIVIEAKEDEIVASDAK